MRFIHCFDSFSESLTDFDSHLLLLGLFVRYGENLVQYSDDVRFHTFFCLVESLEKDREALSSSLSSFTSYHEERRKILASLAKKNK